MSLINRVFHTLLLMTWRLYLFWAEIIEWNFWLAFQVVVLMVSCLTFGLLGEITFYLMCTSSCLTHWGTPSWKTIVMFSLPTDMGNTCTYILCYFSGCIQDTSWFTNLQITAWWPGRSFSGENLCSIRGWSAWLHQERKTVLGIWH